MIYTINGEEVDYIHIDKVSNRIDIQYYEKFDVVTAHTNRIINKLKDKKINAIVCKNLYRGYIGFFLEHIEDYIVNLILLLRNIASPYKRHKYFSPAVSIFSPLNNLRLATAFSMVKKYWSMDRAKVLPKRRGRVISVTALLLFKISRTKLVLSIK